MDWKIQSESPEAAFKRETVEQTTRIVTALVSNTSATIPDIGECIRLVHYALVGLSEPDSVIEAKPIPAVPVKKSITHDYIICLEDGKKFKSLKRHIRTHYNMTPEQYRAKWSLPADYPMTAASYSEKRSQLAKDSGLGKKK